MACGHPKRTKGLVNKLNPGQKAINEQRMKYMETASSTEASDHMFGEQIKNPGDPKLDPRALSAQQWFATDWKFVHKHRVPVVRQTQTGTTINDRAGQTAYPLQKEHMQPMIFKSDHLHAYAAYLEGQRF